MSDPSFIDAGQLAATIQPLVYAVIVGVVGAVAKVILDAVNQWQERKLNATAEQRAQDAAHAKVVADAVANEAGKIIATGITAEVANKNFSLGSSAINDAAKNILGADNKNLAAAVAASGVTPSLVRSMVLGKVGELQATTAPAAPAVIAVAAP